MTPLQKLHHWLFRPVDAASLAAWRIGFGLLLTFEAINYAFFLCLDCHYRDTAFLFKYHHFEWVSLLPGPGLEILFALMAVAGLCITLGYYYRVAMVFYTLGFGYHFLLDQTYYLNHFYLVTLFCVIMCMLPANRYWALDARRKPALASATIPNWSRIWPGGQLEIVLIYAGLVKLNSDWLHLEPMRLWMNSRSADEGPLLQWLTQDPGIALASYGVIALHLIGAPLLLFRRTRLYVLGVYALFHTINAFVFNIGIFPWMTLYASLLLFDPGWPRQFVAFLNRHGLLQRARAITRAPASIASARLAPGWNARQVGIALLVGSWLGWQILVPLRPWLAPGDVAWNEDGHRFSWRMKLRSKSGKAGFEVIRADGRKWFVNPNAYLNADQARKMACIPDMIWQFAQFLEHEYATRELPPGEAPLDVIVTVRARCSLNAREPTLLIDPEIDLTAIERRHPSPLWILPNDKPLPGDPAR